MLTKIFLWCSKWKYFIILRVARLLHIWESSRTCPERRKLSKYYCRPQGVQRDQISGRPDSLRKIHLQIRKHFSLPFLPATPLSPSLTLEGLFDLTQWAPQGHLTHLVCCFPNYLQRNKDTMRCVLLDAEFPGHCQITNDKTFFVSFWKMHFSGCSIKMRSPGLP